MDTRDTVIKENRARQRYARDELGIPTILAGVLWLGIWLIWPWGTGDSLPTRERTLVQFVCAPVRYDPGVPGFGHGSFPRPDAFDPTAEAEENIPVSFPSTGLLSPSYLQRTTSATMGDALENDLRTFPARAGQALGAYSPVLRKPRLFPPTGTNAAAPTVFVSFSGDLATRGFEIPVASLDSLRQTPGGWQVILSVQVDKNGCPDQIFLETGSGNREIDAAVIRAVDSGRARGVGSSSSGSVIVNMETR